jgi:hypothetical protein
MNKIKIEEIPDAINKWINNENDIWLFRYTRSLGYTFEEIVKLSKKNEKIKEIIVFITESMLEKTIYRVADGSFSADLAAYIFNCYLDRVNNLTRDFRGKIIKKPLHNDDFYDDDKEDDNANDNDNIKDNENNGEHQNILIKNNN